jgi:RND family efflux transporter MFP subunit
VGGYYGISKWTTKPAPVVMTTTQQVAVKTGSIMQTLAVSGTLSYYNPTQLTFGVAGTVKEVKVTAGATVAKGDILATFDDTSARALQKAYLTAQQALVTAQTNLTAAKTPYSSADIASAQAAVISAQIAVNTAQDNLTAAKTPYTDADIATAQAAVLTAQAAVNTAQSNLDKAKNPYTAADIANAELAIITAQTALGTAEDNLDLAQHPYTQDQITAQEQAVADAQTNLNNVYTKAQTDVTTAQYQLDDANAVYWAALIAVPPNPIAIAHALNAVQAAQASLALIQASALKSTNDALTKLTAAKQTLADMKDAVANPDPVLISQRQQQLIVAQYNLQKAKDNLATIKAGPDPLDVQQKQQALVVAQNSLTKAKATLATEQAGPDALNIQQKQQALVVAQNSLIKAQQTMADEQAAPDPLNIQIKQLAVTDAQAVLDLAQMQAQNNALVAPSAGTITAVNITAGQTVNANTNSIELTDTSTFALVASVNELDIVNLAIGQTATVNVSALSGQALSAKVGTIAQTATNQSGVVTYKVTLLITAPKTTKLLSGLSATASVITKQANNVLLIPNKAVGGTVSNPTVQVLVNGVAESRPIITGMSDDSYTEVKSGLSEGDIVLIITTPRTTSTSTRASTATSTRSNSNQQQLPGGIVVVTGGPGVFGSP